MTVATTGDSMAGNSWAITAGNTNGEFAIAAGTGVISQQGLQLTTKPRPPIHSQ